MKIHLRSLKEGQNRLHSEEESAAFELPDEVVSTAPVHIEGSVFKQGKQLILKAEILCTLQAECSRCLKSVRHSTRTSIESYYWIGSEQTSEADEDDIQYIPETETEIDLTSMVREAIMLNIPIQSLCSESCKGLCPRCGTDLNAGDCNCLSQPTNSRWSALESLRG